ncbi:MAG: right-handed parallel beta-helix repeat-containing protein [Phycisphaerales bacterium]|nr:right-handed parallel beta-helix repeat-containing protein [Phycisphaerales bacterium]
MIVPHAPAHEGSHTGSTARPAPSGDVLRSRSSTLDARALAPLHAGEHRTITLFNDVSFDIDITSISKRPNGLVWSGRISGEPLGTCTVTIENGLCSAGFWSQKGSFGIIPTGRTDPAGRPLYEFQQLSPEAVTRCLASEGAPSLPPGHQEPELRRRSAPIPDGRRLFQERAATPSPGVITGGEHLEESTRACDCPDDQSIIDVLCVYTTLAKTNAGGVSALQARIQNSVDAANAAYTNSGINSGGVNRLQLRLAAYSEITYDEVAPQWINHLQRVTETADGYMDNVHALRDQFKADVVMLVVNDPTFTGGAGWWAIWDQGQAFSCINWRGLGGGSLLMAHEIGHNLGCAHDYENDGNAPSSFARGHYFTVGNTTYGTIMAYPGDVRLQVFSNPNLTHPGTGQPMGVSVGQPRAAYNAFMIQQTRWTLANYRDASGIIDCNGNGVSDAADIAGGVSFDVNGNCRPDECEERRYADAQTPGPGEGRTWSNAGGNLRELFDLANLKCSAVTEMWIADGAYTPGLSPTDRYGSFGLRSALALHGGFQGKSRPGGGETSLGQRIPGAFPSILSGEIGSSAATDNSYSVLAAYGADSSAILDGFTIEKGYSDWWGGGMYLEGSSPRVSDCTFRNNRAGSGGGVAAWTGGSPLFSGCTFENNQAASGGGGGASVNGSPTMVFDRCVFMGNQSYWGGAIATADSTLVVHSSLIKDNTANPYNGGGIDIHNSQASIVSTLIHGNHAVGDAGGVWSASGTTASVINCTLADNTTDTYTGGLVVYFATADVVNSIFWGHNGSYADQQSRSLLYYAASGTVNYSRVEGWTGALGGAANSGDDPYFADPLAGNYGLSFGSSSIDAGLSSAVPAEVGVDAFGNPRIVDDPASPDTGPGSPPIVDIGALEREPCHADFDGTGFVDLDDYVAYVLAFEAGGDDADFDGTGFVDLDDFVAFVLAFEAGC